MFHDDDLARTQRANDLIDEIAELQRDQLAHMARAERLEAARRELSTLQGPAPAPARTPGLTVHLLVFATSATFAFLGYTLWH